MNHNPFISRNNDLFIMLIAGMCLHFVNSYLFPLTVQTQFLVILAFAFFSGLLMNYFYQSLEWALFFVLGLQIVTLAPYLIHYVYFKEIALLDLISSCIQTGRYSLFLLSSWIIGIPTGYFLQKLLMHNYYRKTLL